MTTTERPTLPADAQPYLAAVRDRLWALPEDERDDLLDDLTSHLAELAAEEGPSLRERLGVPSSYADEFVASAGVDAPAPAPTSASRTWRSWRLPPAVQTRLTTLRPAWLGVRPFLIVFGAVAATSSHLFGDVGAIEIVVLAAIGAAFVPLSQRLVGTWDRIATVVGALAAVVVIGALADGREYVYVNDGYFGPSGVLTRGDGMPVTNIWAYDIDGDPIDVFLFDQNGRPIDDVGSEGYDDRTGESLHTELRTGANGAPIANLYPRPQTRYGRRGELGEPIERRDEPPQVGTPRVEEDPSATSTTTTSTTAPPTP